MASRDLSDADERLQAGFALIKTRFEATFPNYELRPTCTVRSDAEQLEAFLAGRSRIDPRDPDQRRKAMHLAGTNGKSRAIDMGIFRKNAKLPAAYLDDLLEAGRIPRELFDSLYWNVAQLAQRFGFRSGDDWNNDGLPVGPDPAESLSDPYHMELVDA